jgi:hypothetical protein
MVLVIYQAVGAPGNPAWSANSLVGLFAVDLLQHVDHLDDAFVADSIIDPVAKLAGLEDLAAGLGGCSGFRI